MRCLAQDMMGISLAFVDLDFMVFVFVHVPVVSSNSSIANNDLFQQTRQKHLMSWIRKLFCIGLVDKTKDT